MNRYTFNWTINPAAAAEYAVTVPPFDIVVRGTTLALTATADAGDEPEPLQEQADQAAHNLARILSFEHARRFEVAYAGYEVETPTGRNAFAVITLGASASMSASCDFEVRDAAGNVVNSSALQREREQQAVQQRITDLTKRAALDPNLRDMLDHWRRYIDDPEGRLHPLYDVLQVAERLYGMPLRRGRRRGGRGRKQAASALNIKEKDLDDLGDISNDIQLLNGRHPGKSQGPHRVATESEVNTCERVARAVIQNYAKKVVI